jgi:hypothetical protein
MIRMMPVLVHAFILRALGSLDNLLSRLRSNQRLHGRDQSGMERPRSASCRRGDPDRRAIRATPMPPGP